MCFFRVLSKHRSIETRMRALESLKEEIDCKISSMRFRKISNDLLENVFISEEAAARRNLMKLKVDVEMKLDDIEKRRLFIETFNANSDQLLRKTSTSNEKLELGRKQPIS